MIKKFNDYFDYVEKVKSVEDKISKDMDFLFEDNDSFERVYFDYDSLRIVIVLTGVEIIVDSNMINDIKSYFGDCDIAMIVKSGTELDILVRR